MTKEERERLAAIKLEMRTMLDTATTEKRSLTTDEQTKFDSLKIEKDLLIMKEEKRNLEKGYNYQQKEVSKRALFAKAMCDLYTNRSTDVFGTLGIPNGVKLVQREDATIINTEGAESLVPLTIGDVIEPLEKGLVIDKLGIKMQSGLVGDLVFPTLAAIEASIEGENAQVGDTAITIGKLKATPKRVALSVPVSKRALHQTNYSLMDIVMKQASLGVARALNKWLLSGTTLTNASAGPFVKTSPDKTYTDSLAFADVIGLETVVADNGVNVADGTAAYVCSPKVYGDLKSTPKDKGSGRFLIDEDGKLNGYPVIVSNYMDADTLGFGVFSYVAIGQFGSLDFVIDPYTDAKSNTINYILSGDYDIVVARTEAFAIAKKASSKAS